MIIYFNTKNNKQQKNYPQCSFPNPPADQPPISLSVSEEMEVPSEGHDHDDMAMKPQSPSVPKGDLRNTDDTMNTMSMSLYWGKHVVILFSGWPGDQLGMYILALLFVFLIAVAAEILSVSPSVKAGTSPVMAGIIQTGVYVFRVGFLYLVMLSVMSFNVGIFFAAVAGHSLGFFLVKCRAHALANRTNLPKV